MIIGFLDGTETPRELFVTYSSQQEKVALGEYIVSGVGLARICKGFLRMEYYE